MQHLFLRSLADAPKLMLKSTHSYATFLWIGPTTALLHYPFACCH